MFHISGFNMFPISRNFQASYKCFSVSMLPGNDRQDVEKGGKIIMPPSALDALTRLNVEYPMLFKLMNGRKNRVSHAGVLEFVADEGKCYLPYWMMHNLLLDEGDIITLESVSLPVATFSKFQPQNVEFLDITNPKAVLENALRNFACLTTGDVIAIKYNRKIYELCVLETKPGKAVSIIECDMNVEFEAPVGYNESIASKKEEQPMEQDPVPEMEEVIDPFGDGGMRLDGKKKKDFTTEIPISRKLTLRGKPDYDYIFGVIKFDHSTKAISNRGEKSIVEPYECDGFQGLGLTMKSRK